MKIERKMWYLINPIDAYRLQVHNTISFMSTICDAFNLIKCFFDWISFGVESTSHEWYTKCLFHNCFFHEIKKNVIKICSPWKMVSVWILIYNISPIYWHIYLMILSRNRHTQTTNTWMEMIEIPLCTYLTIKISERFHATIFKKYSKPFHSFMYLTFNLSLSCLNKILLRLSAIIKLFLWIVNFVNEI